MQFCDSKCGHCARNFWKWLKTREVQMRMPLTFETKNGSVESGTSFAEEAARSNVPDRDFCLTCGSSLAVCAALRYVSGSHSHRAHADTEHANSGNSTSHPAPSCPTAR